MWVRSDAEGVFELSEVDGIWIDHEGSLPTLYITRRNSGRPVAMMSHRDPTALSEVKKGLEKALGVHEGAHDIASFKSYDYRY